MIECQKGANYTYPHLRVGDGRGAQYVCAFARVGQGFNYCYWGGFVFAPPVVSLFRSLCGKMATRLLASCDFNFSHSFALIRTRARARSSESISSIVALSHPLRRRAAETMLCGAKKFFAILVHIMFKLFFFIIIMHHLIIWLHYLCAGNIYFFFLNI